MNETTQIEPSPHQESAIRMPPKLYLDTSHLINISKIRKGRSLPESTRRFESSYREISDGLIDQRFGLIFNPVTALEWVDGKATLQSAMEIAEVVDTAKLQYEIEADTFVYIHEVLNELSRIDPSLVLPKFELLFVRSFSESPPRALGTLAHLVPEFFDEGELLGPANEVPINVPFGTAKDHAQDAWRFKSNRKKVYEGRVDGFRYAFSHDRQVVDERSQSEFGEKDFQQWIRRFLKVDRIIGKLNPERDVDELLQEVKRGNCASANAFIKAWNHRLRSEHVPKDNDVDDWMYLPAIVYADLVLSERQLAHFARSANPELALKITHSPQEFANRLAEWQ